MSIYVSYVRNGQTLYGSFQGQDEATVSALLSDLGGTNIQFITPEAYQSGLLGR